MTRTGSKTWTVMTTMTSSGEMVVRPVRQTRFPQNLPFTDTDAYKMAMVLLYSMRPPRHGLGIWRRKRKRSGGDGPQRHLRQLLLIRSSLV